MNQTGVDSFGVPITFFCVNDKDLTRPNSPQMVVNVGNSPPATLFPVGEI